VGINTAESNCYVVLVTEQMKIETVSSFSLPVHKKIELVKSVLINWLLKKMYWVHRSRYKYKIEKVTSFLFWAKKEDWLKPVMGTHTFIRYIVTVIVTSLVTTVTNKHLQ
jgi:hypothetical protein